LDGAQEGEFGQPVFARCPAGGAVLSRLIFGREPSPKLGIELGERKRFVG
jgi:hypothetical protein